MSAMKEFYDLVSKDRDLKLELSTEVVMALRALLDEKGLSDEAQKAVEAVTAKVAEAHGIDINAMDEIDDEEMLAVAGGIGKEPKCYDTNYYGGGCYNCDHVNCEFHDNT